MQDDAAFFATGLEHYRAGRPEQAAQLFGQAIAINGANPTYHLFFGVCLWAAGAPERAIAAYREALALQADFAEAHFNLGNVLIEQNRQAEAVLAFQRAICAKPSIADAYGNFAQLQTEPERRVSASRWAVRLNPEHAVAFQAMGRGLEGLQRDGEAEQAFRRTIVLVPSMPEGYGNLANLENGRERPLPALAGFRRAIRLRPDLADLHVNHGAALQDLDRSEQAIGSYAAAIVLQPALSGAYNNRGWAETDLGRFPEAMVNAGRAICLAPTRGDFFVNLATAKRFHADDPLIVRMEALLTQDGPPIAEPDRMALHFALAKAYDDCAQSDDAFRHWSAGNGLRHLTIGYDESATLATLRTIAEIYSIDALRAQQGRGFQSRLPIFVIGMPRSGTTLVEQILSSHPEIFGAGELPHIRQLATAQAFPALPEGDLAALGQAHIAQIGDLAPAASHIVDKMPFNFLYAGLIHLILPEARFIHIRRDPVDTCLSCFSKLFHGPHQPAFSYDLGELGRYYRAYEALMRHWREALPAGVMIEIDYEALIADLPGQIAPFLAHCGLDWHPACAEFSKTSRVVRTASAVQVRQPLYRHAAGRSQAYRVYLGPLLQALQGAD